MYKVMLVDDESSVPARLSAGIPWEKYACEVVGTAHSGLEGMHLVAKLKPDIVITDIALEGMDGLRMVAGIKTEYPRTRVTILTAHRDFDYAQEAIRLGVDRFLIKPSSTEEVCEAVSFMAKKCRQEGKAATFHPVDHVISEAVTMTVKSALEYIEEHYREKIHLRSVADHVYVSQWYLSKLLHRETGKSFPDLVNGIRIREAKKLLQDPHLRISDVSERIGFMDPAHFSRAFKRETGMSAGEYRKRGCL